MIEQIIIEYLTQKGYRAFLEVPSKRPEEFVVVERTGGSQSNLVNESGIVVDSYAQTLVGTVELNSRVIADMLDITQFTNVITHVGLNSTYNDTDTATKEYRYGALFDFTHY